MCNVIVFGGGSHAVEALLALARAPWRVVAAVPCAGPKGTLFRHAAESLGATVLHPGDELEPLLGRLDIGMSVGWDRVFPRSLFESLPCGIVNIHPSLLPRYRGRHAVRRAIWQGEARTGLTAHQVTEKIDAGPILAQWPVRVGPNARPDVVDRALRAMLPAFIADLLERIRDGMITPHAQDLDQGSYYGDIRHEELFLDWRQSAGALLNQIHALSDQRYGARTSLGGKEVVVSSARLAGEEWGRTRAWARPGLVLLQRDGMVKVATGTTALILGSPKPVTDELAIATGAVFEDLGGACTERRSLD